MAIKGTVMKKKVGKKVMRTNIRPAKKVVEGKASVESSSGNDPKGVAAKRRQMRKRISFEVDPAYVSVKKGRTINLGDYCSARFDVSVMLPCYIEDVEKTEAELDTLTMDMLDAEVAAFNGEDTQESGVDNDPEWVDE